MSPGAMAARAIRCWRGAAAAGLGQRATGATSASQSSAAAREAARGDANAAVFAGHVFDAEPRTPRRRRGGQNRK